jgi:tripartite-type tricarboxylate transporter receptor subunit TctC
MCLLKQQSNVLIREIADAIAALSIRNGRKEPDFAIHGRPLIMFISRRILLLLTAAGLATTATAPTVAQTWPTKSITFIVPFPAGGGTDAFARPLAAQLDQQLGQRIIIDNRGGAGGTVGASAARRPSRTATPSSSAPPSRHRARALSEARLHIETDFIPIAVIAQPPQVIVVHPGKVQAKTVAELVDFAKEPRQAELRLGRQRHDASPRRRALQALDQDEADPCALSRRRTCLAGHVAGQVDVLFDGLGSSAAQIQSGALRALAVAAPTRSEP